VPLDPIVSLSVAIAEAPGSQAFLLGSGISREAGVPTGTQVFWQGVGELYRLENTTTDTPNQGALGAWLQETGREGFAYSEILELIAPDPASRRDYLAKHFEGKEPGASHHELAALAEQGAIRVFVTTNFDRLLEHALQARGIEPVIITSAADLASAPRREHAQCYVVKPHGDYLQETIRNTPSELAELEPEMAVELAEIFERYGVVVLGYSGSDAGIADLISSRRSRYGLYWVARGRLSEGAQRITETTGGRVIKRDGASEFLTDLRRRLEVFRSHPSGHTPIEVHDEVLALVRAKDEIGLAEVMRRERREFAERMNVIITEGRQGAVDDEKMLAAHDQMLPIWERRLASLLPVIAYAPDRFAREVRSLVDLLESRPIVNGPTAWPQLMDWATWWLTYATGAFALFLEAWPALEAILDARFAPGRGGRGRLIAPVRENVGHDLGALVMGRLSETNWLIPRWEHLKWSLSHCAVLRERWPEFFQGDPDFRALLNFDLLVSASFALGGTEVLAHWSMHWQGGEQLARRLRDDDAYRVIVADLLDFDPDELVEKLSETLPSMRFPDFANSDAINVLRGEQ
jgi:SIR2-like domain